MAKGQMNNIRFFNDIYEFFIFICLSCGFRHWTFKHTCKWKKNILISKPLFIAHFLFKPHIVVLLSIAVLCARFYFVSPIIENFSFFHAWWFSSHALFYIYVLFLRFVVTVNENHWINILFNIVELFKNIQNISSSLK